MVADHEDQLCKIFLPSQTSTSTIMLCMVVFHPMVTIIPLCDCGRSKDLEDFVCGTCSGSFLVVECAKQQKLLPAVVAIFKLLICERCDKQFEDVESLESHKVIHNSAGIQ
jgi:hypothetical protein